MTKTVFCQKLNEELPALTFIPYPGQLGKRIIESISAPAWQQWLAHQTMLINEYRLNSLDSKARLFLESEMEKFLFGEGSETPEQYVPLNSSKKEKA